MSIWNTVVLFSIVISFFVDSAHGDYNRSFIPSDFNETVEMTVIFSPPAISFQSCCSFYSYPAHEVTINKSNPLVRASDVRTGVIPTVTLQDMYDNSNTFNDTVYVLINVDPDVPFPDLGTQDYPLLHWMIVNIRNGDVMNGTTVSSYLGTAPPDSKDHYYYFMLYEQTSDLDPEKMKNYTNPVNGRFLFNISGFVEDNGLKLVGLTWMVSHTDEYVRYHYVTLNSRDPAEFCTGVEGYKVPCETSGAPCRSTFFAFSFVAIAIFVRTIFSM